MTEREDSVILLFENEKSLLSLQVLRDTLGRIIYRTTSSQNTTPVYSGS